jgi:2-(1,2-epoxy-1,2-dihydrophenyl)acetyl-CoA isomerase
VEAPKVELSVANGVATVILNRPEKLNALNEELLGALHATLKQLAKDPDVRCVVLTGAGRGFCAGGDVGEMTFDEPFRENHRLRVPPHHEEPPQLLHEMPKPTIAMVNGPAAGAGLMLALACDIRIAAESARFGTAFIRVGLSGDFGGTWMLQRLVGMGRARELYFTGDLIDAREAERIGLVNRIVADDKLREETLALALRLASAPPIALATMKRNMNLALCCDFPTLLHAETEAMIVTGHTDDSRKARRAFLERGPAPGLKEPRAPSGGG